MIRFTFKEMYELSSNGTQYIQFITKNVPLCQPTRTYSDSKGFSRFEDLCLFGSAFFSAIGHTIKRLSESNMLDVRSNNCFIEIKGLLNDTFVIIIELYEGAKSLCKFSLYQNGLAFRTYEGGDIYNDWKIVCYKNGELDDFVNRSVDAFRHIFEKSHEMSPYNLF